MKTFMLHQPDAERFDRGLTVEATVDGRVSDVWRDEDGPWRKGEAIHCQPAGEPVMTLRLAHVANVGAMCKSADEFLAALASPDSRTPGRAYFCEPDTPKGGE